MAKLIVVYRLRAGVTADAFEDWMTSVTARETASLRRLEAFATALEDGPTEYVEVYHIPEVNRFEPEDLPAHVDACITGDYAGLDGRPRIRVSNEPN